MKAPSGLKILVAFCAGLFLSTGTAAAAAYAPVLLHAELMGGFKDGKWYNVTDLPVTQDGKNINVTEGTIDGQFVEEKGTCETPLLSVGTKLTCYTQDGKKQENTVSELHWEFWESSGQLTVSAMFVGYEDDRETIPFSVGVAHGGQAQPWPTVKTKGRALTFSCENGGKSLSASFVKSVTEDGQNCFKGTLRLGEKTWPLEDIYPESADDVECLFIDINGDGRMELVQSASGPGGSARVYTIDPETGPKAVLSLDLGE